MHQSPAVHLKKAVPGANSPFPMHRSGENYGKLIGAGGWYPVIKHSNGKSPINGGQS